MTDHPSPPGRLSASDRRALGSVAGQFFANGAMTASFAARLPELRDQIGVDVALFGVLLTAIGSVGLVSSVSAGRLIHRIGTRRVLTVGALAMPATLPVIGGSESATVWALAMMAYAFLDVLVDISMNLQGSWISARRRTPVMNRLHGVWSLGTVFGGLAAAQAASAGLSPTGHLSIVAGIGVIGLLAISRGMLAADEDRHADAPAEFRSTSAAGAGVGLFALLALGGALAVMIEQVGSDWAAFRLADDFGASPGLASLAYVAFTAGMTMARFAGDSVQARIGRERLHHLALVTSIAGLVCATLIPVRWVSLVGYLLAGAGVATFMPKLYDDAARAPGRRGAGLGVMTGGMRVGGLVAPALVGALAGTALSVGEAVALVTLSAAAGFAAVTTVGTRRARGAVP